MLILIYLIVGSVAGWGMIKSQKSKKPIYRFVTISSTSILILVAVASPLFEVDETERTRALEEKLMQARLNQIGKELGNQIGTGGMVLVLHNFTTSQNEVKLERQRRYLQEGFGTKASIKKMASLPNADIDYPQDNSIAHQVNTIIKANSDCNIVVFLGSLPPPDCIGKLLFFYYPDDGEAAEGFEGFDADSLPLLGLANGQDITNFHSLFVDKRIDAAYVWNRKLKVEGSDETLDEVFAQKYIMVSCNSVEQMNKEYDWMFFE